MFQPLRMLAVLSTLVLSACGTQPTPSVSNSLGVPVVDSSLLQKPTGLASYQLPSPSASASNAAATDVKLSEVAAQHANEAAYTAWLELMVNAWQDWYAKLQKTYGTVSVVP